MCVRDPKQVSVPSVIAYKVMYRPPSKRTLLHFGSYRTWMDRICADGKDIISAFSHDRYRIGSMYEATIPKENCAVSLSDEYKTGFHAYKELETAIMRNAKFPQNFVVVEVELLDVFYQGREAFIEPNGLHVVDAEVFVAHKCKFLRVVPD